MQSLSFSPIHLIDQNPSPSSTLPPSFVTARAKEPCSLQAYLVPSAVAFGPGLSTNGSLDNLAIVLGGSRMANMAIISSRSAMSPRGYAIRWQLPVPTTRRSSPAEDKFGIWTVVAFETLCQLS